MDRKRLGSSSYLDGTSLRDIADVEREQGVSSWAVKRIWGSVAGLPAGRGRKRLLGKNELKKMKERK